MTTFAIVILATAVIVWIVADKLDEAGRRVDAVLAWDQACADREPDLDTWADYPMPTPIADRRRRIAAEFDHDLATIRDLPETQEHR